MIYLWSVHSPNGRQTFWGQEHFQANITIYNYNNNLFKKKYDWFLYYNNYI
jgi:hypothetical protein